MFYHYKKSRKLYSQLECEYHANILKRKVHCQDKIDGEHMYDIYYTALKTLGALMTLLMLRPQWIKLQNQYALCEEEEVTPEATIKVLLRARKMYEARAVLIKVMRMIFQLEKMGEAPALDAEADRDSLVQRKQ